MAFACLTKETSAEVIQHLKYIFARHGIPQELISDNGPQFTSWEFFSTSVKANDFIHTTSCPRYPEKAMEGSLKYQSSPEKGQGPSSCTVGIQIHPIEEWLQPGGTADVPQTMHHCTSGFRTAAAKGARLCLTCLQ